MTRTKARAASLFLSFLFSCQNMLPAQAAPAASAPVPRPRTALLPAPGDQLDLSSSLPCMPAAGLLAGAAAAVLNLGGVRKSIDPCSMLTRAESIALAQVRTSGQQSLALDAAGRAVGGVFSLNTQQIRQLSSLVIPQGVVAVEKVGSSPLNIDGLLNAQGIIVGLPTGASSVFNIRAQEIQVGAHGAITTQLIPCLRGLPGTAATEQVRALNTAVGDARGALDLSLVSTGDINNYGLIAASGALNLAAGGSITNQGVSGAPAVMAGGSAVTLVAGAGQLNNTAGLIASSIGNVSVCAGPGHDLLLSNLAGSIQALAGNINLGDNSGANLSSITGGVLAAQNINVCGGQGSVNIDVDRLDGVVNVRGSSAFVSAREGTVLAGQFDVCGDPTVQNSGGDVLLSGNLTFPGQNLAILASGNVGVAAGATVNSIDVSSTNAGGSLSIVAGFDFAATGADRYQISGASAGGGSINLPSAGLHAGSQNAAGGMITVVAHRGTLNQGAITLGSVESDSLSAGGGSIALVGQGGVSVRGNVEARGASGGTVFALGTEPQTSGTVVFQDGQMVSGHFANGPVNALANYAVAPAVAITGLTDVSGTSGASGTIAAVTTGKISLGALAASGANGGQGGSITVISLASPLSLAGINANGGSGALAGAGGNVVIQAPSAIAIGGDIQSCGGSASGGAGGAGGTLLINTANNNPNGYYVGSTQIAGVLNVAGGSATAGAGGKGGTVDIRSGTIALAGNSAGISILASGGSGASGGADGTITLKTFGTQPLPSNFNLTSTSRSEIALPGGLFVVGNGGLNGAAGKLTVGSVTASAANAGHVTSSTPFSSGTLNIIVSCSSATIDENGASQLIVADSAGVRNQVTPGEALALYLVSRNSAAGSQSLGVNASGQVTGINPSGSKSLVTVNNYDLPAQFTAFNLQTASGDGQVDLLIQGTRSSLNLPSAQPSTIAGGLVFAANSLSTINFGSQPVNLPYGSTIGGTGMTLTLTGKNLLWTNNGIISAGTIIIDHQATPLILTQDTQGQDSHLPGSAGLLSAGQIVLANPGTYLTIKNGAINGTLTTDALAAPLTALTVTSQFSNTSALGNLTASAAVKVTSTSGALQVAPAACLSAGSNLELAVAGGGDLTLAAGARLSSGQNMKLSTLSGSIIDSGSSCQAGGLAELSGWSGVSLAAATSISGAQGVSIGASDALGSNNAPLTINGSSIHAQSLAVNLFGSGTVTIGSGSTITAGQLAAGAPVDGVLATSDLISFGSVIIGSERGIDLKAPLVSNGGDLRLFVGPVSSSSPPSGNIVLANGLRLEANGGNILMFVKSGTITGASETLRARAVGAPIAFRGGGIEVAAGRTLSQSYLLPYFSTRAAGFISPALDPAGTVLDPSLLGARVTVDNNGIALGTVASHLSSGGSIDISDSTLSIKRGAAEFAAGGAGNSVIMPSSVFQSSAVDLAPGGFHTAGEVVVGKDLSLLGLITSFSASSIFVSDSVTARDQNPLLVSLGLSIGSLSLLSQQAPLASGSDRQAGTTGAQTGGGNSSLVRGGELVQGNSVSAAGEDSDTGSGAGERRSTRFGESAGSAPGSRPVNQAVIRVNQLRSDLLFFTQASQMLQGNLGAAADAQILGTPGTAITNGQTVVVLHSGHIVAGTGHDPLTIETPAGNVVLGADCKVAIQAEPGKAVKIKTLSGPQAGAVEFKTGEGGGKAIPLKTGEGLIVGEEKLADEDLIPVSGEDVVVGGGIIATRVQKCKFSPEHCSEQRFLPAERIVRLGISKKRGAQKLSKGPRADGKASKAPAPDRNRWSQARALAMSGSGSPVHILAAEGTEFYNPSPGTVELLGGAMFLECLQQTEVQAGRCHVTILPGGTAALEFDAGVLRVKSCSLPGKVRVVAGGKNFELPAGRELVVTGSRLSQREVMTADGVGRRAIAIHSDGRQSFALDEFSIPALLKCTTYLRPLRHRHDRESVQKWDFLLKLAVAVEMTGRNHGRYQVESGK